MQFYESFFYALGTLIATFVFAIPPYALSKLWNKLLPKSAVNPWGFPFITTLGFLILVACFPPAEEFGTSDKWIILLGFLPPLAVCLFRYARYRRELGQNSDLPQL